VRERVKPGEEKQVRGSYERPCERYTTHTLLRNTRETVRALLGHTAGSVGVLLLVRTLGESFFVRPASPTDYL
jgi:hypothetical protein